MCDLYDHPGLPQYIAVEESDRLIALDLNGLLMKVEKIVPCLGVECDLCWTTIFSTNPLIQQP